MEFNDFQNPTLGSWAIEQNLFDWLLKNVPRGKKILELGSGAGTIHMAEYWKVTSIEHNEAFINFSKKSEYIHAPIVSDWYDVDKLDNLPEFDLLLIDGPSEREGDRIHLIEHLTLFKGIKTAPIIVDDVNRQNEYDLLLALSVILNRTYKIYAGNEKSFGVIE